MVNTNGAVSRSQVSIEVTNDWTGYSATKRKQIKRTV